MSPKFINGSFAALFDHVDVVAEYARHITRSRTDDLNGCPIRLSPRRPPQRMSYPPVSSTSNSTDVQSACLLVAVWTTVLVSTVLITAFIFCRQPQPANVLCTARMVARARLTPRSKRSSRRRWKKRTSTRKAEKQKKKTYALDNYSDPVGDHTTAS